MAWVFGIVILILFVVSAGFRKFTGIIILISVAAGFLFWIYQENEEEQSKKRISPSELLFEDESLKSSYSSHEIVGRITNTSNKYTLKGVELKLTFRDCNKEDVHNCIIVAEENEHIYINIPPKQARDFKEGVYLYSDLNVKGKLVWDYKVEYAKAE